MLDFKTRIQKKLGNNKDLFTFHYLGQTDLGLEAFEIVLNPSLVIFGDNDYVDLYCLFDTQIIKIETFDLTLHTSKLPFNFAAQLKWETDINGLNKTIKRIIKDLKIILKLINK